MGRFQFVSAKQGSPDITAVNGPVGHEDSSLVAKKKQKQNLTGGVDILSFEYLCTCMSCLEGGPPLSPQPQDEASTWRGRGPGAPATDPLSCWQLQAVDLRASLAMTTFCDHFSLLLCPVQLLQLL